MATSDGVDVSDFSKTEDVSDGNVKSKRRSETSETQMATPGSSNAHSLKTSAKEKIGHRRVDETGTVTYKKKPTSELMAAIQLGIGQSVGSLTSKPERDLLMQDFAVVESVFFPAEGSNLTPAHRYSDYRFKTYAPIAFRYFRELFNIQPDDFLLSLCDEGLKELSNPGASGSIFYLTQDDEFIIKTVQHKEAEFLQKLLPGYYMNLNQNPRTLLPKFYGFYCYQCGGKNIRFVVMNNLLPSSVKLHEKYDLKGSTYKRKASKSERSKSCPTLKDLDFLEIHNQGILLEKEKYDALVKTIQRDCRVLESFKIMDYSLLLGIYNLDLAAKQKGKDPAKTDGSMQNTCMSPDEASSSVAHGGSDSGIHNRSGASLARAKSIKGRIAQYSTAIESINQTTDSDEEEEEDDDIPPGGIPAKNDKGERLLLYLGIIDILQSYRLKKKLEHTMKAIVIDGDTISVHRPSYYSQRFQEFMSQKVFRKMPTPLKHSPSKRKPTSVKKASESEMTDIGRLRPPDRQNRTISFSDDRELPDGTKGGRPDLLPENSTPPPTFAEALASDSSRGSTFHSQAEGMFPVSPKLSGVHGSPPLSLSESTPTHTERTEGTPSYTPSSPSCYSDIEPAFQNELDKEDSNYPHTVESTGFITVGKDSSSESQKLGEVQSSTSNDSSFVSAVESLTTNNSVDSGTKNSSGGAITDNSEDQRRTQDGPKVNKSEQRNEARSGSYQQRGEGQGDRLASTNLEVKQKEELVLQEEEMHSTSAPTNNTSTIHGDGRTLTSKSASPHSTFTKQVQTFATVENSSVKENGIISGEFILREKENPLKGDVISKTGLGNARKEGSEKHVRFRSIYDRISYNSSHFGAVALPDQPKMYKPVVLRRYSNITGDLPTAEISEPEESTHL